MSIYIYILPKELQHVRTMGTLSSGEGGVGEEAGNI